MEELIHILSIRIIHRPTSLIRFLWMIISISTDFFYKVCQQLSTLGGREGGPAVRMTMSCGWKVCITYHYTIQCLPNIIVCVWVERGRAGWTPRFCYLTVSVQSQLSHTPSESTFHLIHESAVSPASVFVSDSCFKADG